MSENSEAFPVLPSPLENASKKQNSFTVEQLSPHQCNTYTQSELFDLKYSDKKTPIKKVRILSEIDKKNIQFDFNF